ncbi:hypothetical protein ISF_09424 [Cordyceps fumosorosea ARSEF 2679]|uniref:Uncharacterized protein n=1 Tax=Cordyceps fumosorosea (strain ARSEF 2679) TaxID=1081104 RepID=A0A167ILU0_CORFA|nr:hypothetical protein ISF_09424 [Cordyceps fumosorosea ARSEF 2679]OAA49212.1 hypothetical protein ISF_09424 [Cordyceps fumosorosea ARSEF 2679]
MLDATGAMLAPQALALCQYYSGMLIYAIDTYLKERQKKDYRKRQAAYSRADAERYQQFFTEPPDGEAHPPLLQGPWSVFRDQFSIWRTETGCPAPPQHYRTIFTA